MKRVLLIFVAGLLFCGGVLWSHGVPPTPHNAKRIFGIVVGDTTGLLTENFVLSLNATGDTLFLEAQAGAAGGTADSIGIDLDGDGTPESWAYSTGTRGILTLSEGANITFTLTGDTLEIAGGAGGGSDTSLFLSEAVGSGTRTAFWSDDTLFFKIGTDTVFFITDQGDSTIFSSLDNTSGFKFNSDINMAGQVITNIHELIGRTALDLQIVGGSGAGGIAIEDPAATTRWTFTDSAITGEAGSIIKLDSLAVATLAAIFVKSDMSFIQNDLLNVERIDVDTVQAATAVADLVLLGGGTGDLVLSDNNATRWTISNNRLTGETGSLIITDSIIIDSDTLTLEHLPAYFVKLKVHNATGATLDQGTPVFISGATGDVPNADSARADDSLQMPAVCILDEDIANGADGFGIFAGDFHMFNTSGPGWSVGDPLYVAPTGGLTSTQPVAPNLIQKIGEVTRVNVSQGEIYVFGAGRSNDLPHFARFDLDMNSKDIIGVDSLHTDKYADGSIDSLDLNQVQIGQWLIDTSDTRYETITNVALIGDDTTNFLLAWDSVQAWDNRGYAQATSASLGIASFSTDNFDVVAGAVTVKVGGIDGNEIAINEILYTNIDYSGTLANSPTTPGGESFFGSTGILFEGATGGAGDAFELLLWAEDPTQDDSLKLPATSGTLAVLANLADSIDIKVDSAGDGTNVVAVHPIIFKEGSNITLTVDANGDTVTIAGPAAGGTADSMGVDTDGDGTVDNYLYSTVAGAMHIKKGSNITLTVDTDTLIISGAAGAGTADSMGVDTDGDGTVDGYMYSTVAGAMHLKKGSAITLTLGGDTTAISIATGDIASVHIADQTIVNADIDTTAEDFAFADAFHITTAEADSAYVTAALVGDTAGILRAEMPDSITTLNIFPRLDRTYFDTTLAGDDSVIVLLADSAGKALADAAGNTITSTYETITNVALIGDDTTNFLLAWDSVQAWDNGILLWADGSIPLTADWAAGAFDITGLKVIEADTIRSDAAGTPIVLGVGDTLRSNANATMVLGSDALAFKIIFNDDWRWTSGTGDIAYDATDTYSAGDVLSVTGGVATWEAQSGSSPWAVGGIAAGTDTTAIQVDADNDTNAVITDDDAGAVLWDIGADQSSLTIGAAGLTTIDSFSVNGTFKLSVNDGADIVSYSYDETGITNGMVLHVDITGDSTYWDTDDGAGGGTSDSTAIDTSGGGVYAFLYSTAGAAATYREGSAIDLTVDTDTGYIAVAADGIDTTHLNTTNLAVDEDIMTFETGNTVEYHTPAELTLFSDGTTGDVTTSGDVSTIGTSTIDSLMFNQVEIGQWILDTLSDVISSDITMTNAGVVTIADNVIDTNHLATANLAVDEEIMTFETGNTVEYHTPAELGLMLAADFADSADNHLDTAEVVTIHSDSGLASRDTIQFALTISAPNGFVQDTLVILKTDASIYSDSIIFTELALETRQATTDSAWIEVWTDIDHTGGTETVIDTLGKTTTQSIEASTFNARGAAQGSYVMLIVRLADASATEWHVRGSFWEKR